MKTGLIILTLFVSLFAQANYSSSRTRLQSDDRRNSKHVGAGISVVGPLGVAGLNLELLLTRDTSLIGGFGSGGGFQSYTVQLKHVLGGRTLLPYVAGGYARWYNFGQEGKELGNVNPSYLRTKLLNESQKRSGIFTEHLLYPALGAQYVLDSGSSIYAEALYLLDIIDIKAVPTATIGYTYYF